MSDSKHLNSESGSVNQDLNSELDNSDSNQNNASCSLLAKEEEEIPSEYEIDNISSGKSKINKLLTEMMANNKKHATNTFSINLLESKANHLC